MRRWLIHLMMGLLLSVAPVAGQTYEVQDAPTPKEKSVAKEWLIGTVFLIGCLVVAFKPARRANLR
ncbi:MAG: hypothetical protein AMXMBFR83_17200 [Phycisphaerae bacterium]